jgi:hypothetical protein
VRHLGGESQAGLPEVEQGRSLGIGLLGATATFLPAAATAQLRDTRPFRPSPIVNPVMGLPLPCYSY